MIYTILSECWEHDIFLTVVEDRLIANYERGTFQNALRFKIKQFKPFLIKRIQQNEAMKASGWIVGLFGDVYEYQFSFNSYLYMERDQETQFTLWRSTESKIGTDYYKKILYSASFEEAYEKAAVYLQWWEGRRRKGVI
ncbi:hypothetical protein [Bacillus thermotolerans]|uniref:hypothetical protein n=1 Tax=Bacillus thermotolerans TaxID=1221996 RepID=UPI00057CF778|nr:hypothetical protein [Bacillus thermotolerans]KKB33788.1 hypothetical protein QY97_02999 [Bacillus thermotolerans]